MPTPLPSFAMLSSAVVCLSLSNLLASVSSQQPPTQTAPQQKGWPSLDHPSWSLGLQLYSALRHEGSPPNTLICPLLLTSSLNALSRAAKGATARQLQDLLKAKQEAKNAQDALESALESFSKANGTSYSVHASSALFSKQVSTLDEGFLKELQAQLGLDHVALGSGAKQADMDKLSSWAKGGMGGAEGALLPEGADTKKGTMILASALRFKGFWAYGFDQDNEDLRNFLGSKDTKVQMMHRAGVYQHYEDIQNMVQVLELGLWGGKASVVLLLPFHVESLARLERLLSLKQLQEWLGKLSSMGTAVWLPRVNISSTLSLQKQLVALGVVDAWDQEAADFSSLGRDKLHLSDVLHWASLELALESGSEDGAEEEEHVKKLFYADHSFMVLVKDNSSGALLLLGALDLAEGKALHDEL